MAPVQLRGRLPSAARRGPQHALRTERAAAAGEMPPQPHRTGSEPATPGASSTRSANCLLNSLSSSATYSTNLPGGAPRGGRAGRAVRGGGCVICARRIHDWALGQFPLLQRSALRAPWAGARSTRGAALAGRGGLRTYPTMLHHAGKLSTEPTHLSPGGAAPAAPALP